jgi:Cu/Ag efflux protein CusF
MSIVFAFAAASILAFAQKPVSLGQVIETTAEIVAIDHDDRLITLEGEDGESDVIQAGPEVKRFDDLKVGDKVTFRYYESLVTSIRKPGDAPPNPSEPAIVRGTGPKPSATMSEQLNAAVTIKAVDPKVPSVTFQTDDGRTMSIKVADKKNIQGLKAGDRVDVTYTAALMITVK